MGQEEYWYPVFFFSFSDQRYYIHSRQSRQAQMPHTEQQDRKPVQIELSLSPKIEGLRLLQIRCHPLKTVHSIVFPWRPCIS